MGERHVKMDNMAHICSDLGPERSTTDSLHNYLKEGWGEEVAGLFPQVTSDRTPTPHKHLQCRSQFLEVY